MGGGDNGCDSGLLGATSNNKLHSFIHACFVCNVITGQVVTQSQNTTMNCSTNMSGLKR